MCVLVCILAAGLFWESETEMETKGQSEKDKEKNLTSHKCSKREGLSPSLAHPFRKSCVKLIGALSALSLWQTTGLCAGTDQTRTGAANKTFGE